MIIFFLTILTHDQCSVKPNTNYLCDKDKTVFLFSVLFYHITFVYKLRNLVVIHFAPNKGIRFLLSAEFSRYCVLSGGTHRRAFPSY